MSNLVATTENQTQKIDNVSILTNGELFNRLRTLSEVMANSGNFVPEHYRGKPDACMAVVMQAARWGMDPFAVAQKTFIVGNSGVLGYEAQLVNAVINTMAPTKDRIHFEWFGAWENIVGRFIKKPAAKVTTTSRRAGICKMKLAWASAPGQRSKENQSLASLC